MEHSLNPPTLISVRDVEASSKWYQTVLGLQSGHGGAEYEQLVSGGRMVLQLHDWDAHAHPHLGRAALQPPGIGVALWFQTDVFDEALQRIRKHKTEILEGPQVNTNANHREVWLRDPDGYVVVVAGAYSDLGSLPAQ
jgi:catechol 2,3-dioxygenase-like lactoylglutathione lyase family enzyme